MGIIIKLLPRKASLKIEKDEGLEISIKPLEVYC